ncbi:hypothetical protein HBH56_110730 [Parastagonospora nodorum]|uniref:CENP-V/GFA domain-containing protein n=1 Tax=Phaeosphaeria nodorum (strain SN15 / ATCC MYA-4574 / FGSC 10173) TaxID=321614 RepID=A0A7U2FDN8_PHANO|nr:hypothetical protein HBH56_110730 [Parastagonospora nodorum]QRD03362.1 hypothetical protein JI435_101460 [Parastagonospora nodorum SN15]KAH3925445.1 hypothetical protein HBH54_179610 [Parastagonospora nodorum]KAH3979074.1 hypothetical protein HBH52_099810 [Parastagonospora nodorum]KAH3999812.1 hypothetical protein HBI10_113700 [Parastagonospora nodorum]
MVEGRCNCASIKVTLPELPKESVICYCANCRRGGGTFGSIVFPMTKDDAKISDAKGTLKSYTDNDTTTGNTIIRQFCSDCGSPVASLTTDGKGTMYLKGGLFDQIPKATYKSFEQNEPSWVKIG